MKFTHMFCYLALCAVYLAAAFGLEKQLVYGLAALVYFLLALEEIR